MSNHDTPLPVELVPRPDNRLLLATIAVLGSALLVGLIGVILLALNDVEVPEVLGVTVGTVAGSLGTLLVRTNSTS